ncbi:MAG: ABC transporter permease [Bacteroidetes bacterium]|nr:ABC transporter permease [Bacteroidota bacterium]
MMHTPYYIAKKLSGSKRQGSRMSRITSGIVTGSVALSITVIIIALAIVSGFRTEIRSLAGGFSGQVLLLPLGADLEGTPVPLSTQISYLPQIESDKEVSHLQHFANCRGLLQTDEAIQGVVLKGVGKEFDRSFFEASIIEGSFPVWNDSLVSMEILVSRRLANALKLRTGQAVIFCFIDQPVRFRQFKVSGIYGASLENIDKSLVIGDIRVVQQLHGWSNEVVSGVELLLHRPERMEEVASRVAQIAVDCGSEDDPGLWIYTAKDLFPHLFDWLNLIDMNLLIVLALMIGVAGINMITGLLIMLFDKTSLIGLLKALGMKAREIRLTFIYRMSGMVIKGMLAGNALALLLCYLQQRFQLLVLDPVNYAVSTVPVQLNIWTILLMNAVSFWAIVGFMLLATTMINRISPDKSLRIK